MNYCKIRDNDIANGTGIRVTLFVSGCRNHCKNCFQPETWDFDYGYPFTRRVWFKIFNMVNRPYIAGLSILGGEPFEPENQKELVRFLRQFKNVFPEKNVWCYTGFTIEELLCGEGRCCTEYTEELLSYIDILVDGRFVEDLKDISLKFRGSSNQRILNLKEKNYGLGE